MAGAAIDARTGTAGVGGGRTAAGGGEGADGAGAGGPATNDDFGDGGAADGRRGSPGAGHVGCTEPPHAATTTARTQAIRRTEAGRDTGCMLAEC